MIYLDTGCFLKLYYPETDSARLIALVQGQRLCYTPFHELELVNAMQLKVFLKTATAAQARETRTLVEEDLGAGVLVSPATEWAQVFLEAASLAAQHTAAIGCRSLDILHCAAAKVLAAGGFISTDARQTKLAAAMGLNLMAF